MSGCCAPLSCWSGLKAKDVDRVNRVNIGENVAWAASPEDVADQENRNADLDESLQVPTPRAFLLGRKTGIDSATRSVTSSVDKESKQAELLPILALRRSPTSYENDPQVGANPKTSIVSETDALCTDWNSAQSDMYPEHAEVDRALKQHATILCGSEFADADANKVSHCEEEQPPDRALKVHATILCGSAVADGTPAHGLGSKHQRFDFGVGMAFCQRCQAGSWKVPCLNRGCETCNKRMCHSCFLHHQCSVLESAHDLSSEVARSTPHVTE